VKDAALAGALARAVRDFDKNLILVGLAGSRLPRAGAAIGLRVAHEAFADRRYEADGSLTPRREAGAVIHDIDGAVAQAVRIATAGKVETRDGNTIDVRSDTICVHGDRADAALFARNLREALMASGIVVAASATG